MIHSIAAQFAIYRIWQRHSDAVTLHELSDTRDNFAKQVAQLQLGHNPIGYIQQ